MTTFKGKQAEEFVKWLNLIKGLLPPTMLITEAQEIFLRREKEKDKNETQTTAS